MDITEIYPNVGSGKASWASDIEGKIIKELSVYLGRLDWDGVIRWKGMGQM